jgi:hypothetical protein
MADRDPYGPDVQLENAALLFLHDESVRPCGLSVKNGRNGLPVKSPNSKRRREVCHPSSASRGVASCRRG